MHKSAFQPQELSAKEKSTKKTLLYIGSLHLEITESILKNEFDFIVFHSSFEALPWLKYNLLSNEIVPDVVISDLEFPGGDAFSMFDFVKNLNNSKHIPFIALSSNSSKEEQIKAMKKGIDDLYFAPFNWNDIYSRVKFLQNFKKQTAQKESEKVVFEQKHFLAKRVIDVVFSLTALILLSPLILLISLLIKIESKGPVFYISQRAGSGYKIIDFFKFRTMHKGAENELEKVLHLNRYPENSSFVKIKNDPRVTFVGRILRRTSLDELPQLINVLKGDMSLVGNRPLPLYEAQRLTKDQLAKRFLAPAGITGLWQVSKRGKEELSDTERIQLDITYADKTSDWYDMKILLKTIPALLQKESV